MREITQIKIPGTNFQPGRGAKIDQITFHHIVGDAQGAIARFQQYGVQVSSTYIIGSDGQIYQCVAEGDTPYTDANFNSNSRAITIEHAGGIEGVPYTEAMYEASIELCAWIRSRYNITRFMRHRDVSSVPTACPGDLDVERIVNSSQEEPMFNEGDRVNFNVYFFGGDYGQFGGEVNKPWKEAAYNIMEEQKNNLRLLFNEGDRANVCGWLYGTDPGYHKDMVGKDWKNATVGILTSKQFIFESRFNEGDAGNFAAIPNISQAKGLIWKQAAYNVVLKNLPQGGGNGGYTAADRATATETNSLVKQIWQKITSLFK